MDAKVLVQKIDEYEQSEKKLKCKRKHLSGEAQQTVLKEINKLRSTFKKFIDNIKIVAKCNVTQRWLLAKQLHRMNKITCISADSIGDSFALEQADVGMTMKNVGSQGSKSMSDLIIDDDIQILLDSIKFGRNIFENIRKFLQF
jgi:Ca2+-transporting ATPase